ncbi:hypothetical protein MPSEU_000120900 [Mayamaea pseudoterrestris]|nr:hypothetical protein MPSEU_000120900 [Mayamaea pseudoterrestris]
MFLGRSALVRSILVTRHCYYYYSLLLLSRLLGSTKSFSVMTTKPRGAFIVLEGVDRCGKTTQVARLVERMTKEKQQNDNETAALSPVLAMRFPDRTTPVGRIIHEYLTSDSDNTLDDHAIHLLFSSNRWEASEAILQHLRQGTTIVCDRYVHSGVAFSSAKVKAAAESDGDKEEGNTTSAAAAAASVTSSSENTTTDASSLLSLEWCMAPDKGLPAPDCVIFLDMEPEQAAERGGYGNERYEQRDMQLRVRKRFHELQNMDAPATDSVADNSTSIPWYTIAAAQSMDQVEEEIYKAVQTTLSEVQQGKPLGKMWEHGAYDLNE